MMSREKARKTLPGLATAWLLLQSAVAQAACPDVEGESYNPFLAEGRVLPAPLKPVEFNGTGQLSFIVGNTGGTEICVKSGDEATMRITIVKGVPNNVDPIAAIGGAGKDWFSWTYDPSTTTYNATQILPIPGGSPQNPAQETITIDYKVTENSFFSASPNRSNGFNMNLQPPGYTNATNNTDDDTVSSYTYVEAFDYGDAPTSYGEAVHEIDLSKTSGQYNQYIYLGSVVDPEDTYTGNDAALADDWDQTGGLNTDDEDGVAWPATLDAGVTTPVPVSATLNGYTGVYVIQHWVDWGNDGSFAGDEGAFVFAGGGASPGPMQVAVPAGTPDGYYYARVRISTTGFLSPDQSTANGEVEDYLIVVGQPTAVTIGSVNLEAASVTDFLDELGVDQMDTAALRSILRAWDRSLAGSAGSDRDAIVDALQEYLDPDGDGRVAVLHWDTLEERGTVGFFVERSDANGEGATLINNDMLPGLISAPMGGEYMLADPVPTSGNVYQYRFIEQEATGNKREYGPYNLEMPQ